MKRLQQNVKNEVGTEKYYYDEFLKQLSVIQTRLARKYKVLKQIQKYLTEQIRYLIYKMEKSGKDMI